VVPAAHLFALKRQFLAFVPFVGGSLTSCSSLFFCCVVVRTAIEKILTFVPPREKRQTLLFSATVPQVRS